MKKITLSVKQKEFLKELRDLLSKYNADISWTCDECSDTFGLVDDRIVVDMVGQKDDIDFYWGIDKYNIDEMLKGAEEDEEDEEDKGDE